MENLSILIYWYNNWLNRNKYHEMNVRNMTGYNGIKINWLDS